MAKEITHEEWIKNLEELCFIDTGKRLREGDPIFEEWLKDIPVDRLLELEKNITK